ncbi:hybrid sensor histidine kinase/response regulator [Candidatus Protochlamydia phocaeensis]|uniref:hybrid sensor histidine kinase/response regulator n=1 Tax=Candidatus Protochlamydia phocaeensis TaxID=1414722 RepID=UPI000838804D|nr:hybrid sensor histidine kinase/response regulator [Candidatus Protochlamydia phocaeensis]
MNFTKATPSFQPSTDLLLVEDSLTQAMLLKETLEKHGFHVNLAKDGIEAIEMLKVHMPDLIISDIEMPRMDGFEFCRYAKNHPQFSKLPVIILTNLSDSMDVIKGIECGADSFLTKPCTTELLLNTISDVMENRKLRKTAEENLALEFSFHGQHHLLKVNQAQITDLLLSTYANAMQKNRELEQAYRKLAQINQDIERKNEELQVLNNQKNLFLGMAAHDLRNPLTAIQAYSDILLEKLTDLGNPDVIKLLNRIQKSSHSILVLINDLLDLAAIESGMVKLNLVQTNLDELIKEGIALNAIKAEQKQIDISFKQESPHIPSICCDPEKIEQVLNNLINNAIKYSRPQTHITISLARVNEKVLVTIQDQGVGIPQKEMENLFNPFTKTSAKTTGGETSTGLGLAIAKRIIHEHKGNIWAESEVGKGSTFHFTLPLETAS